MEALGSPSISRAPMGECHAFRILKTGVCRWQVQRQYTFVRKKKKKQKTKKQKKKKKKNIKNNN